MLVVEGKAESGVGKLEKVVGEQSVGLFERILVVRICPVDCFGFTHHQNEFSRAVGLTDTMPPTDDVELGPLEQAATSEEASAPTHSENHGSTSSTTKEMNDSLDAQSNIEVLEISSASSQWEVVPVAEIPDPSLLPSSVSIRLFLVEGLTSNTIKYFSNINTRDFFQNHRLNVLPYDLSGFSEDRFFGKWSHRVLQNSRQRDIEERITRKRPWSLNIILDPKAVGLDHDRYERAKGIVRPHSSLESGAEYREGYARVAVDECISVYYQKVDTGLIGE